MNGFMDRPPSTALSWHEAWFEALSTVDLHAILAARIAVFVVEQRCPYQEVDDFDLQALHLWATAPDASLVAYARILPPGTRYAEPSIGRVLSTPPYRALGLGRELMQRALILAEQVFPGQALRISAQQYLEHFYLGLGFAVIDGPYDEDGIPHLEMLRSASSEQGKR